MPGLVPGIHVLTASVDKKGVDGRDKPGHDEDLSKRNYRFNFQRAYFKREFTTSPRNAPEPLMKLPPKRAWGTPDAQCTRGLVCNDSGRTHTSNNEYTGITRRSRTQWF